MTAPASCGNGATSEGATEAVNANPTKIAMRAIPPTVSGDFRIRWAVCRNSRARGACSRRNSLLHSESIMRKHRYPYRRASAPPKERKTPWTKRRILWSMTIPGAPTHEKDLDGSHQRKPPRTARPIDATRNRTARRSSRATNPPTPPRKVAPATSSLQLDPRVEVCVDDVHHQVREHVDEGGDVRERHDPREVLEDEHGDRPLPHAREREHSLREDRPAQQPAEAQSNHRRCRDHRVPLRVLLDYDPLAQSLRPGGLDVVLPEDLQHRGPHHPCDEGHRRVREGETR